VGFGASREGRIAGGGDPREEGFRPAALPDSGGAFGPVQEGFISSAVFTAEKP
jgi:hypothetical protein